MQVDNQTLYYRQGGSDKIYCAEIVLDDGGYLVNYAYGRRGNTLKSGTKTSEPVPIGQAQKIFEKLLKAKKKKGYTVGEDGMPYSNHENGGEYSGISCQLLNPVSRAEALSLCANSAYLAQMKYDGERRLISVVNNEEARGINRRGFYVALPKDVVDFLANKCFTSMVVDGEQVGDQVVLFDILEYDGEDYRTHTVDERLHLLQRIFNDKDSPIHLAKTAYDAETKQALFKEMELNNKEGVVFKLRNSLYKPSRPSSGGSQLKFKFYVETSVVVDSVKKNKRSVNIMGVDKESLVPLGAVTIPSNHSIPKAGDVIEVKYLYAFKGGSLFQPTFIKARNDLTLSDCSIAKLKYKAPCLSE